jgi:hypothetical protein
MSDDTGKKFKLSFVNAAEDIPRQIRAYGKACHGEFGLVLRPTEQRGALVLIGKDGARFWRSQGTDAPSMPEGSIDTKDAVALVKTEQKAMPEAGPITLKGQWSGWMHCDNGTPRVEITRKLAAYGVLTITSSPKGWTWAVTRTAKWFSKPGADTGTATTLSRAIEAGLARAMGLLGEACSVRDSRRRGALDAGWAVEHPVVPAKEGKDPLARMEEEKKRAKRERWPAAPVAPPPETKPARPPRTRAPRAPGPPAATAPPDTDAAKDKALLDAFSAAVAQAVTGRRPDP